MPLAIVLVALLIARWGAWQRAQQAQDVRRHVAALLDDLAAGRDPAPRLGATDPLVARPLVERLEAIMAAAGGPGAIVIDVIAGDAPGAGQVPQPATHTAVLRAGDREALALRLLRADGGEIVIIGYWTPSGTR